MWTPPQWPGGFAGVFAATVLLSALMLASPGEPWLFGIAVGVTTGLFLAMAWTIREEIWPAAAALATGVIPLALLAWMIQPRALPAELVSAFIVIALWLVGYGQVTRRVNREAPRPPELLGGDGSAGAALIVHHPSKGGFHTAIQRAFAEGLRSAGWRVTLMTASSATPTDLSRVDLLVLGAPAYNFRPARPLMDFIVRLGSLKDMRVVLMVSGGGMTDVAMRRLRQLVEAKGGRIEGAYELWVSRSNLERYDIEDPFEIMRRAGRSVR